MQIKKTKFKGLKIVTNKIYKDSRGYFKEDFKQALFKGSKFIFSCTSRSKKNVLRGLHMQTKYAQGKYLSVLKGEIFDTVVDLRKKSKNFGKSFSIKLSEKNGVSLYIPPGFAHGFVGLKKENVISYHCTNYRSKKHEIGLMWNDKDFKINWPIKKPILSAKDKKNFSFKDYLKKHG